MHFLQAINSDLSVLVVCNKTGGTIKGDIKKIFQPFLQIRLIQSPEIAVQFQANFRNSTYSITCPSTKPIGKF